MKEKIKKITYISIVLTIVVVTILIVVMVININNMYSEYKEQALLIQNVDINNTDELENTEEASINIGKTIEESKAEKVENNVDKQENVKKENAEIKQSEEVKKETINEPISIPAPTFIKPVEGEIIKEYSQENLVYSETLKEWTTHVGVDIQADLTTVVKSAEEGIVKSIKNDPRYGLTVIIEHVNGYETRYSNLLTAEFVVIGEKVKEGQTIGTVGNTASFEVLDAPHLHFEILKNSEYLNPILYIK